MKDSTILLLIGSPLLFGPEISTPILGVPLNAVVGAMLGAFCSLGVGEPIKPRGQMWFVVFSGIVMGCAATSLIDFVLSKGWNAQLTTGAFTGLTTITSFSMRFFLPWMAKTLSNGRWTRLVPFFKQREDEK